MSAKLGSPRALLRHAAHERAARAKSTKLSYAGFGRRIRCGGGFAEDKVPAAKRGCWQAGAPYGHRIPGQDIDITIIFIAADLHTITSATCPWRLYGPERHCRHGRGHAIPIVQELPNQESIIGRKEYSNDWKFSRRSSKAPGFAPFLRSHPRSTAPCHSRCHCYPDYRSRNPADIGC